ncbi:MAG: class I SAM-dependent methyltransferase [Planctomycetota bacterium]
MSLISRERNTWLELWERAKKVFTRRNKKIGSIGEKKSYVSWRKYGVFRDFADKDGEKRHQRELSQIKKLIRPDFAVIDVGAGDGRLTIPVARMCNFICAIEPYKPFIKYLEKKAAQEGVHNIKFINKNWEDVNLRTKYDLVICAWGPFDDRDSLLKIHNSSRKYCVIFTWFGYRLLSPESKYGTAYSRGVGYMYDEIYRLITGRRSIRETPYMHVISALYREGIYANVQTTLRSKFTEKYNNIDQAMTKWIKYVSRFKNVSKRDKKKLWEYYHEQMNRDGTLVVETEKTDGAIWWEV